MKCFKDGSEIEDIDRAIALMKEAERILTSMVVQDPEWKKGVPVRTIIADRIIAQVHRMTAIRMDMQEDGFQYRKNRRLPPSPDGYR